MMLPKLIAKRIKKLLKERNWTKYELAIRSGLPFSTLYYTLSAKGDDIKSATLLNICRGFDIDLCDFFNDDSFRLANIADDD